MRTRFAACALVAVLSAACSSSAPEPDALAQGEMPLQIGFLIVDGVYNTELMAPYDIFHHTVFHVSPGMHVFTVAPTLEPVVSFEGLRILPDYTYADAPPIDVLVVPSAEHSMDSDLEDEELVAWVRAVGCAADYVMSLCDGAFVLAQAGLLDGREVTTFPADIDAFRKAFPQLEVHAGISFVHDGPTLTSVGGAKSYDAALYLCEVLYGASVTRGIAGGLCIDWDLDAVAHIAASGN